MVWWEGCSVARRHAWDKKHDNSKLVSFLLGRKRVTCDWRVRAASVCIGGLNEYGVAVDKDHGIPDEMVVVMVGLVLTAVVMMVVLVMMMTRNDVNDINKQCGGKRTVAAAWRRSHVGLIVLHDDVLHAEAAHLQPDVT